MLTPNKLGRLRDALRTPAAGPALALPQSANLAAFWNPDTITGQADNSAMASWTDAVSGIAMTQATTANQPVYRAATGPLGKPLVYMGGSAMMSTGTNAPLSTIFASGNFTVMVLYRNAVSTGYGFLNSFGTAHTSLFAAASSLLPPGYSSTTALGDYVGSAYFAETPRMSAPPRCRAWRMSARRGSATPSRSSRRTAARSRRLPRVPWPGRTTAAPSRSAMARPRRSASRAKCSAS